MTLQGECLSCVTCKSHAYFEHTPGCREVTSRVRFRSHGSHMLLFLKGKMQSAAGEPLTKHAHLWTILNNGLVSDVLCNTESRWPKLSHECKTIAAKLPNMHARTSVMPLRQAVIRGVDPRSSSSSVSETWGPSGLSVSRSRLTAGTSFFSSCCCLFSISTLLFFSLLSTDHSFPLRSVWSAARQKRRSDKIQAFFCYWGENMTLQDWHSDCMLVWSRLWC